MKKNIITIILMVVMVINITSCGTTTSNNKTETKSDVDLLDPIRYKSEKKETEYKIAVIVKDGTSDWFKRMKVGVDKYGNEMSVNVIQKGPANADAASQVQLVEDMINQGVDAICIVPTDPGALESTLKSALEKGIVVVSHEASNLKNTLFDVEAFTADSFGQTIMMELAKAMSEKGEYAQMVAYTTSTTHMEYSRAEYEYQKANYPNMSLINDTVPSAESAEKVDTAYQKAKELLKANPNLAGFTGAASVDILGQAQAVEELGLSEKVSIVGVGTPNACKDYVMNGTIDRVCLWDPALSGYAMCSVAYQILQGKTIENGSNLGCEGYESVQLVKGENRCLLGNAPLVLSKDNIGNYDF